MTSAWYDISRMTLDWFNLFSLFLWLDGLGSGIKRALEEWRDIDFTDDLEGCLFTVTTHRKVPRDSFDLTDYSKSSGKTENQVFTLLSDNPEITIPELAEKLGLTTRAMKKQIAKLREKGRLRRIGPARGGRWQTIEMKKELTKSGTMQ